MVILVRTLAPGLKASSCPSLGARTVERVARARAFRLSTAVDAPALVDVCVRHGVGARDGSTSTEPLRLTCALLEEAAAAPSDPTIAAPLHTMQVKRGLEAQMRVTSFTPSTQMLGPPQSTFSRSHSSTSGAHEGMNTVRAHLLAADLYLHECAQTFAERVTAAALKSGSTFAGKEPDFVHTRRATSTAHLHALINL